MTTTSDPAMTQFKIATALAVILLLRSLADRQHDDDE